MPEHAYARELPPDIRQGRTGVPVVDESVRTLYASGYLHNHARMWLASYLVHVRHVHWRAGADWMYAHLLDGDLASNHLSWQWIAGTGSHQPYLFNADNVARYAPESWHSYGTAVDASYEAIGARAAGARLPSGERAARRAQATTASLWPAGEADTAEPALSHHRPGPALPAPDAQAFAGREVWLVHPWSLDGPPRDLPAGTLVAGLWLDDHHARWSWSRLRWDFVGTRMDALAPAQWRGTAAQWRQALAGAAAVRGWSDPHLGALGQELGLIARPPAFAEPAGPCRSFTQFWRAVAYAD
jgi:deoxyribodipyrimidine photo-lyase